MDMSIHFSTSYQGFELRWNTFVSVTSTNLKQDDPFHGC